MHAPILPHNNGVHEPQRRPQRPLHSRMAPERRTCIRKPLRPSTPTDLRERRSDERLGRWYHRRRPSNLRHGGRDEVALHQLHGDVVRGHFRAER